LSAERIDRTARHASENGPGVGAGDAECFAGPDDIDAAVGRNLQTFAARSREVVDPQAAHVPAQRNLAAVRILENEAKVQDEAVVAAQRSLDLSITRYKGGVTSYLEVITAQSAALADEVTAVNILGRRMANTVLLIQALGGGWERSSLPERPECCGKLVSSNSN